jgi:hypothetical protein
MLLGKVASGKTLLSMQIDVMAQDNPAGSPNESGEISLTSKTQRQRQQRRLLFDIICGWSMKDERDSLRLDDGCFAPAR